MIKAEELRRGNIVNRQFWNPDPKNEAFAYEACRIHVIKSDNVNIQLKDKTIIAKVNIKNISPVQLSPAILEKCGFETLRSNLDWYYIKIGYMEISINVIDHQVAIDTPKGQIMFYKCESLHRLQNLVYSLTVTELTITL